MDKFAIFLSDAVGTKCLYTLLAKSVDVVIKIIDLGTSTVNKPAAPIIPTC